MSRKLFKLTLVLLLITLIMPVTGINAEKATIIKVDSIQALEEAVKSAQPGYQIVLDNGTYSGVINLTGTGTSENNIIIRAESKGGVVFTGKVSINIKDSLFLELRDFKFDGAKDDKNVGVINIDDSNNCRITNNSFVSSGVASNSQGSVIIIQNNS